MMAPRRVRRLTNRQLHRVFALCTLGLHQCFIVCNRVCDTAPTDAHRATRATIHSWPYELAHYLSHLDVYPVFNLSMPGILRLNCSPFTNLHAANTHQRDNLVAMLQHMKAWESIEVLTTLNWNSKRARTHKHLHTNNR